MRIGCVIASRIPAIAFASVWRAAKPTTRPSTAEEARMPLATLDSSSKFDAASATPIRMMPAETSRRITRRRVFVAADSSPRVTSSPTLAPRFAISAVDDPRDDDRDHDRDRRR